MMQTEVQEKPESIVSTAGDPGSVRAQKRDTRTATEVAAQRRKNAAARRLLQEWLALELLLRPAHFITPQFYKNLYFIISWQLWVNGWS